MKPKIYGVWGDRLIESTNLKKLEVEITDSEIWASVGRVRSSQVLMGCKKLMELLAFVVKVTLDGQKDYLKETMIGVYVFGRSPDYDPKLDTIVRSHVWRLRKKLKQYYRSEGSQDPLLIEVPKGHYIPVFRIRKPGSGPQAGGSNTGK